MARVMQAVSSGNSLFSFELHYDPIRHKLELRSLEINFLHLAGHSHPAIQSKHNPIQHDILHTILHHPRKLLRLARSRRKFHNPKQAPSDLVAHHCRHPGIEQARCDRDDSDAVPRKVPRQRKGEGRYGAFTGGVCYLPWLTVKCSGGRYQDQDASFTVWFERLYFGEVRKRLTNEIDGAADVDVHDEIEAIKVEGFPVSIDDLDFTSGSDTAE